MGNNNIINGNCWVAYFDILGFKEKISAFDGHLDAFERNFYSNLLDKLQRQGKYWPDKVFTAWASDTFLFFTRDDSKSSFGYIAKSAKHFYWDVMPNNWPLRTAIGFGQLYADRFKSIFLGSGLIDAYEYAEKQNWIGIVVTPKANSKLRELGVELQRRPAMFKEYDVPVKRKVIKNGICTIVEETERLFAMRIHEKGGINAKGYIEQMQRDAMNDKDYEVKYKVKYENTLRFFEETE